MPIFPDEPPDDFLKDIHGDYDEEQDPDIPEDDELLDEEDDEFDDDEFDDDEDFIDEDE